MVPTDLPGPSGGSNYNDALARALRAGGHPVAVLGVPGPWPRPRAPDRAALAAALRGRPRVVLDGIIGSACPAEIAAAEAAGTRVHVLVHLPLPAETGLPTEQAARFAGLEREALRAAGTVICTSHWAARDVADRYGPLPTRVLLPGTAPAPPAAGSTPPHLLLLASITPRKNHLVVLEALAGLTDLDWRANLVGPAIADPAYARRVREFAATAFSPERVRLTGARTGADLEAVWSATDLLLLVSRAETYGMVVTEALARGIPAVVGAGTGAQEALGGPGQAAPVRSLPGAAVDPADPAALEAVLREWFTSPARRREWREAAATARDRLPTWDQTAHDMHRILTS